MAFLVLVRRVRDIADVNPMPPAIHSIYHEYGHVAEALREGCDIVGIEFFNPGAGMEAVTHFRWVRPDRSFIKQELARKVRVAVAGLHSQALFAPTSIRPTVRQAIAESAFLSCNHSFSGRLTTQDLADFSFAQDDLKMALGWASGKLGRGSKLYRYLRRRELEVRRRLSMPRSRRAADRLVTAVNNWFNNGGATHSNQGPLGGYCVFPKSDVLRALQGG